MLYVFQVDTGTMLTFDINIALDSFSTLTSHIYSTQLIPPSYQVILVSGGLTPPPAARVCSYPSGTDTNPIFLFNKSNIESEQPLKPYQLQPIEAELDELAPSYSTLIARSNKALEICEASKEIFLKCETLIHDQHLQHQGWAAVVCNLEDIVMVFKKKLEAFGLELEGDMEFDLDKVEGLPTTIENLQKIHIPQDIVGGHSTLYTYLNGTSAQLHSLYGNYQKNADLLDKQLMGNLRKEGENILDKSNESKMKEIKGLSNRLYRLDELLETLKKILKEQQELSNSLVTTTARAKELSDKSILPDLCESHLKQLQVMVENLRKVEDIQRRFVKAKEELIVNLNSRLKWVIYVQKQISEINLKLSVYLEALKKFRVLKTVISQVVSVESVYYDCLAEVARRCEFEKKYNAEVSAITERLSGIFNGELERRKYFKLKNEKHFLYNTLFEYLDFFPSDCFKPIESEVPDFDFEKLEKVSPMPGGVKRELNYQENDMDKLKTAHAQELKELRAKHEEELDKIKYELRLKYEQDLNAIKDKNKNDIEAVKSRVKFVAKVANNVNEDCGGGNIEEFSAPPVIVTMSKKLSTSLTCKVGEKVLVYFSDKYESFMLHSSSSVHFVHNDCVESEGLLREFLYTGNVVDKEYCVARRAQNRYKVPQGYHFYRVKITVLERFTL